jgi:hypothetical protein
MWKKAVVIAFLAVLLSLLLVVASMLHYEVSASARANLPLQGASATPTQTALEKLGSTRVGASEKTGSWGEPVGFQGMELEKLGCICPIAMLMVFVAVWLISWKRQHR